MPRGNHRNQRKIYRFEPDRKRAPMGMQLAELGVLPKATTENLERLLKGIQRPGEGVTRRTFPDGSSEPEGPYRHRLMQAIMRREKQLAQGQD